LKFAHYTKMFNKHNRLFDSVQNEYLISIVGDAQYLWNQ
jgi:uncharacterized protein YdcH (DUF465 family)